MTDELPPRIEDEDWPLFGWSDDIRPALGDAIAAGRPVALATLYKVEGSAPEIEDATPINLFFYGDEFTRREVQLDSAPLKMQRMLRYNASKKNKYQFELEFDNWEESMEEQGLIDEGEDEDEKEDDEEDVDEEDDKNQQVEEAREWAEDASDAKNDPGVGLLRSGFIIVVRDQ